MFHFFNELTNEKKTTREKAAFLLSAATPAHRAENKCTGRYIQLRQELTNFNY